VIKVILHRPFSAFVFVIEGSKKHMNLSTRKIGIITIDDASNLGNRLQNYALQTVLQDMSVIAETLFCISDETLLTKLEYYAKNIVKYIIDYKLYRSTYKVVRKRKNIFKQFNEQKILKSLFVIKKCSGG
jgi:hypothetical protein